MVSLKTRIFLLCLAVIFLRHGRCEAEIDSYVLKDLEKLAVERSPVVKAAEQKLKEARSRLQETRLLFGPEFSFQYRYFPQGGLSDGTAYTKQLFVMRLRQDLIQLLKIKPKRIEEMEAEVESAEAEFNDAKIKALYELRKDYTDLLAEKAQADFYLRLKDIYRSMLDLKVKRYLYEEALLPEVLRTEKDLIEAKDFFLYHTGNLEKRRTIMAESLGIKPDEIKIKEPETFYFLPSEEKLMDAAIKNRGEIKRLEANARQEKAKISYSAYEDITLYPYLSYGMREHIYSGYESGPEIGVVFSIPLMVPGIAHNRTNRFKFREGYYLMEEQKAAGEIKKDIRTAYEKYLLANARYINAEKGINLKTEEMRIEQSRLQNATKDIKADPLNLLAIEADITTLNLEKEIARYEKNRLFYELMYLAGFSQYEEMSSYGLSGTFSSRKLYPRALWVWGASELLENEEYEAFFISFCRTKGIKKVFFSINKQLSDSLDQNPAVAKFIVRLHQHDIKISALMGENSYIYPGQRERLIRNLQNILSYNSMNEEGARFDAVHLDIEPHTLKEWETNKRELLNMLAETLTEAKGVISSGGGLQMEVDIPVFYDKIDQSILMRIVETADVVTVMAYEKKKYEEVIEAVKAETKAVVNAGKEIIIGFNAKDFSEEAEMEELIAEVGNRLSGSSSFAGFGVHDFKHYRALSEK